MKFRCSISITIFILLSGLIPISVTWPAAVEFNYYFLVRDIHEQMTIGDALVSTLLVLSIGLNNDIASGTRAFAKSIQSL
ncbi:hypothetical protein ACSBR2_020554 [Camellia fascicularis]